MSGRGLTFQGHRSGGVVDAHTHFIPPFFMEEASGRGPWGVQVEARNGLAWAEHDAGYGYPIQETFFNPKAKLTDMDHRGIDRSILSLTPTLFFYWIAPADAAAFARRANEALAEMCRSSDARLYGLATLPMQEPVKAAAELRRAVQELGLRGAEIGTSVESVPLDDDSYTPVWEAADELDVPVMLHPYYVGPKAGFEDYYLTNTFVNPLDTALAAARLIHSGVLDRFPRLRFFLVHAGGFLPYQIGRFDHGWSVRDEPKRFLDKRPSELLGRFYFDTITHHDGALSWLVDLVGADHVLLGTDLPFDMADVDPVGRISRAIDPTSQSAIAGGNALDLFGLKTFA